MIFRIPAANNFFRIFWNRNCLDDLDLNDVLENVRNNILNKFRVNLYYPFQLWDKTRCQRDIFAQQKEKQGMKI